MDRFGLNYQEWGLIAEHLRKLGEGEVLPIEKSLGICSELCDFMIVKDVADPGDSVNLVAELSEGWPKHSERREYPVPSPDYEKPHDAYAEVMDLWADTPYGNDRRELCLYIAKKIQDYLAPRIAENIQKKQ